MLGAYLAWSLICAEVMFAAAKSKDMPAVFAKENANKVPANALWLTNIIIPAVRHQHLFLARCLRAHAQPDEFRPSLIPYLFVAAYGYMISQRGETYQTRPEERKRDLIIAAIAVIYTIFMLYAGGLKYILLAAVLYAPGTILYIWARREQGKAALRKVVRLDHLRARRGWRLHRHLLARDRLHQTLNTKPYVQLDP